MGRLRGHMWAKWLRHRCKARTTCRCEMPGNSVDGMISGYDYDYDYVTLATLLVPTAQRRDEITRGYLTPTISGAHMSAKWPHSPSCLGGTWHPARGGNQKGLT